MWLCSALLFILTYSKLCPPISGPAEFIYEEVSTCDLIRIYPFIVFTLQSCTFYCGTTMNASFVSSFRRVVIFGGAGCRSCLIGLNYFVLSGNNRAIHVTKKNLKQTTSAFVATAGRNVNTGVSVLGVSLVCAGLC